MAATNDELLEETLVWADREADAARAVNTKAAHDPKIAESQAWHIDSKKFVGTDLVTERKALAFLQAMVLGRASVGPWERRCRPAFRRASCIRPPSSCSTGSRSPEARADPAQRVRGLAMTGLLKRQRSKIYALQLESHANRSEGHVVDSYDHAGMLRIMDAFWTGSVSPGVFNSLRAHADFALRHFGFLRGDNTRDADLCDLWPQTRDEREGPQLATLLVFCIRRSKTNVSGKKEYTGLMRHSDQLACGMSAMAFWFFYRWHHTRGAAKHA